MLAEEQPEFARVPGVEVDEPQAASMNWRNEIGPSRPIFSRRIADSGVTADFPGSGESG